MNKRTFSIKKEILAHIVFWIIWMYFNLIEVDYKGEIHFPSLSLFNYTWFVVFLGTFYLNYILILPKVFRPFKWIKVAIGVIALFFFFIAFRYFLEQFIAQIFFDTQNYFPNTSPLYYAYDNLFFGFKPILISTIFGLVVFLVRTLAYNKLILEENKNAEIKFLKAQINPHFVFNTLNNIYSMVYFQSEKSLPAIEKLSQIMRFTTYESQKETIKLLDEINYIKAYIELEQLRHEDNAFVHFDTEIESETIQIPPYILSPLVENALKHGVASNTKPIKIGLTSNIQKLTFTVKNEIKTQKKDKLGGIGLDNLKKRLEIHYPHRHSLILVNESNRFTARLQIDLKNEEKY